MAGGAVNVGSIQAILYGGLEAVIAFVIAVALVRLASAAYGMLAPHDAEAVPLLHVLALAAGGVSGLTLLLALPHAALFSLNSLFSARGPWEFGIGVFLQRHALPDAATLHRAVIGLGSARLSAGVGWLAVLLLLAGPLAALRWWHGRSRLRAIAAFLMLAASTAVLLHYAAHLLAWAAAQLNFWLFAVALILFQRRRYAAPSAGH
jgi:hypothetical protein